MQVTADDFVIGNLEMMSFTCHTYFREDTFHTFVFIFQLFLMEVQNELLEIQLCKTMLLLSNTKAIENI